MGHAREYGTDGRTVLFCLFAGKGWKEKKEFHALMFLIDGGAASCLSLLYFVFLCLEGRVE